jgi:LPS export ABC transporter permease LptG/LPS export ABC transporter permease LptF
MRILNRYIFREMLGPTAIGFAFYTFVILMRTLFDMAEMIIKRSLPPSVVVDLLALSLPNIVVLTVPMALLFGILIAIGRLSADSEIIALRSLGLPTSAIYKPVFVFSFAIFLVNLYLMNWVLPGGNAALQKLKGDVLAGSSLERAVKPRIFFNEFENRVIYINDVDTTNGTLKGVFMSDASEDGRQNIVVAREGNLSRVGAGQPQLWLDLRNAEIHVSSEKNQERYDLFRNELQRFKLVENLRMPLSMSKSVREMDLAELQRQLSQVRNEYDRRLVLVEIHKKFSIPFACLAFGIVGLPLGITNRRGGKSSGFTLSIGIILLYYVLLNNGTDWALTGVLPPWLALWLPNIALVMLGMFLIRRANREAGASSQITLIDRIGALVAKIRKRRQQRLAGRTNGREGSPSLLGRLDIAFPNTLDRYVLREFAKVLAFVVLSTAVLFLIVDYTEISGHASENNIPTSVVIAYYRYFILQIIDYTIPLSVLLATLITFGILSKNNEITAIKANGISLYRVALPVLSVAAVVCVISYLLLDFVLPYANERAGQLKARIKGDETARVFSEDQRQWIFGKGRYLFNFLSYDEGKKTLSRVQVFEFHPTEFRLTRRIYAEEARFDGTGWWFVNGWIRSISDDGRASYTPMPAPLRLHYPERPEYFASEVKAPNQMTYSELRRYIADLQRSGYAADELMVELYRKTSWPFISLIMTLIALPFAFRIGKRGALYGVGIAIALAFVYWSLFGVFTKFGEVGNLPAILSAWSANILFAIAAIYMFLRVET